MDLTIQISDDLASRMGSSGGDLSRRALEALALEEFKSGHITKPELRRLLGFGTRYQLDGFLKAHDVCEDYTLIPLSISDGEVDQRSPQSTTQRNRTPLTIRSHLKKAS